MNKSLIAVGFVPVLTRIIRQFPEDTEFVIALGYKGELVREYLELAHPDRTIVFCDVDPYEGPGSGLGLSLLACRDHLLEPFVFISCDTLVEEAIPSPDRNWVGYALGPSNLEYRSIETHKDKAVRFHEKGASTGFPYIGLAGIRDCEPFWGALEEGGITAIEQGEVYGLQRMLRNGSVIHAEPFTWHDTGNAVSYAAVCRSHENADDPVVLEKPDEAIWFVDGKAIKFSDNEKFIHDRVARAGSLAGFVPDIDGATSHMYRYPMVEGTVFSKVATRATFSRLLDWCLDFWERKILHKDETEAFRKTCEAFYYAKTMERVEQFYRRFRRVDDSTISNGRRLPPLSTIISTMDWLPIISGEPTRFHGDMHFENILWSETRHSPVLLDWRQSFGDQHSYGDVYYDLAKLMHGLIVNHDLIAHGHFSVSWEDNNVSFDFLRKQHLVECQEEFDLWLVRNDFDKNRVYIITALIFLNIAALHHHPYSLLLYSLGKEMLHNHTSGGNDARDAGGCA